MCDDEPMPPCACLKPLPFSFTSAMNSRKSFDGKFLRATITAGECAVGPIGTKSRGS
jgi:hypothetical protein